MIGSGKEEKLAEDFNLVSSHCKTFGSLTFKRNTDN